MRSETMKNGGLIYSYRVFTCLCVRDLRQTPNKYPRIETFGKSCTGKVVKDTYEYRSIVVYDILCVTWLPQGF